MADDDDSGSGMSETTFESIHSGINAQKNSDHMSSDGGFKLAGNIPARPAGPGGDQPNTNPFPTKTGSPPFGRRTG